MLSIQISRASLESHPQSVKAKCTALRFDADELNDFFATTAQRTLKTRATPIEDLTCLIDNLPDDRLVLRAWIRYLPASSRWLLSAWQSL